MLKLNQTLAGIFAGAVLLATTAGSATAKVPPTDKSFMIAASYGNHAEIAASKLALKNSQDPKVKGVAQTIINEHSAAQAKLQTLADKLSVKIPQGPDPAHKAKAKKLASLRGNSFDNAYISAQMVDHGKAISLFKGEMANGKQSEVRSYATETLGNILAHNDTIHAVAGTSSNMMMSHNPGSSKMGTGSRMSSSSRMGGKMSGTSSAASSSMSSGFKPQPRTSPTPSASPAPGIN